MSIAAAKMPWGLRQSGHRARPTRRNVACGLLLAGVACAMLRSLALRAWVPTTMISGHGAIHPGTLATALRLAERMEKRHPASAAAEGKAAVAVGPSSLTASEAVPLPSEDISPWPRVSVIGDSRSFLLEIGGQRLLVNPRMPKNGKFDYSKVHEWADYVVITSAEKEHFDSAMSEALLQMNSWRVNCIASPDAAEKLRLMMMSNVAQLNLGPEGGVTLMDSGLPVTVRVLPGRSRPEEFWKQNIEASFLFVDERNGVIVGYEAFGNFMGYGAGSKKEGIPEQGFRPDILITSDLEQTFTSVKGLASRASEGGAPPKIVALVPDVDKVTADEEPNPIGMMLRKLDMSVDQLVLGGAPEISGPSEFRKLIEKEGGDVAAVKLVEVPINGDEVTLDME